MFNVRLTPAAKVTADSVRNKVKKELEGFSTNLLSNLKSATPVASGRARRGWTKRSLDKRVKLVNRVPYIERLQNNYSKQTRGKGIVKPAISKTRAGRQRSIR